jgi:hypothetical protein
MKTGSPAVAFLTNCDSVDFAVCIETTSCIEGVLARFWLTRKHRVFFGVGRSEPDDAPATRALALSVRCLQKVNLQR